MKDPQYVDFLQWALPRLRMRWPGFRKVRGTVCKRIDRRLRELGLADVAAYRVYLEKQPSEWGVLDRCCRIPISRFYRDRGVFNLLGREVLPALAEAAKAAGDEQLRVWSAGSASGEEPYTLQIIWHLNLQSRFPDLRLSILATDADQTMLQRARAGCYPASSLKDLPQEWLTTAFDQEADSFLLRPEFRENVEFQLQDIRDGLPSGPFHLILCRHLVFTYFDDALQETILREMCSRLAANGVLVTGKQEGLPSGADARLACWAPHTGVYRLRTNGQEAAER